MINYKEFYMLMDKYLCHILEQQNPFENLLNVLNINVLFVYF